MKSNLLIQGLRAGDWYGTFLYQSQANFNFHFPSLVFRPEIADCLLRPSSFPSHLLRLFLKPGIKDIFIVSAIGFIPQILYQTKNIGISSAFIPILAFTSSSSFAFRA